MSPVFIPARIAAQHCAELVRRGPRPEERAALLLAWRRDLSRQLADDMGGLLSGDRLEVRVDEPETVSGSEVFARIGPMAANSLLRCGAARETALLSFDFATAIALTDRSFGGDGRVDPQAPDQLPRSAALLVDEAAMMIAQAVTLASLGDDAPAAARAARGEVIVRSESAPRLKPFTPDTPCVLLTLVLAGDEGREWRALLALPADRFDHLLPGTAAQGIAAERKGQPDPGAMPFAAIPMALQAVLAEFDLSLARLQTLSPGEEIPLTIARQVPLRLGDAVLAFGSIGTIEDRMAVRLTRFPDLTRPAALGAS